MSLGQHLVIDIWTEINHPMLMDMEAGEKFFNEMLKDAGVTILANNWHHFGEGFGYTGVVVLAESHLSAHCWNEHGFVAIDVFVCGSVDPKIFIDKMVKFFNGKCYQYNTHDRGVYIRRFPGDDCNNGYYSPVIDVE